MKRRRHKPSSRADLRTFNQELLDALERYDATETNRFYRYMIQTPAGPLQLSPYEPGTSPGLWIHACFDDEKRATKVLYPGERLYAGGHHRLNPHSGKWNFTDHTAFIYELDRLMDTA